ncbi:class I SAM-dependent methyltransferase [Nocardiopsis sp. MG754419]|uniref:class I SAM-dependent methyltransferase n=1 Tax=Nocardiopsis sp. MG754419 TaxID=2259865 RepID=UPI001BAC5A2D|nr:class I SAM-dependent methyltransferase [Nocardiopsis sp. MG754419]MBR8742480.1 SAM-dependent methyltransferase [Nocardiopsis sp. MG754419]
MDRGTDPPQTPARYPEPAGVNAYDGFAEAYAADNESNLQNAYYERPAMVALAGDVTGHRILDAGCGAGPLAAALRDRGAEVTGIDGSAAMLDLARRRLGDDTDLREVDLRDPLPFADGAFDDVVASLVLHYLEDWGPTLTEIRRVLRPGGRLLASVQHPFTDYAMRDPRPDYFAVTAYSDTFTFGERSVPLRFWRRPLHAMTDAFTAAGLRLSAISEPQPDPAAREVFPDGFQALSTRIGFLFFVLEAPPSPGDRSTP